MLEFADAARSEISPHEVVLYLLLNLAIIIAAARVMGQVARRLGQPAVIGEISAGIILGPTILGRINSDWPGEIFPRGVPLEQISSLGLVFFMFLVGLELDLSMIRTQARKAVQISLAGILMPFALGFLLALGLYSVNQGGVFSPAEPLSEPVSKYTFALFIGAAMCITAFPILARMLVETGLYRTAVGVTTLCAGAVDDVIAWVALAGVVGIVQGGSPAAAGQAFVLTALFAVALATVGRWGLDKLAQRYETTGRLTVDQVAIVLCGVLLSAYATELIGVHAIFGAFIFGAVMPKRAGMTHQLTDKIEDFTVIVLLPVFFLVAGLRTDLFQINSPSLIGWTVAILAVATIGKFVGCAVAARFSGTGPRESVVIGALMNTRGLTELVILTIGLELGVLSDRTFAMMVIMALGTTVVAAPIVNRLMPRERVLADIARAPRPAPAAARVLLMAEEGAPLRTMARVAERLIGARRPAEVLLLRTIPVSRTAELRSGLAQGEALEQQAAFELQPIVDELSAAAINTRVIAMLSDDPVADVASICEEQAVDTVVIGWNRKPGERLRWRRTARRVMSRVNANVIAVADGEAGTSLSVAQVLAGTTQDGAAAKVAASLNAGEEQITTLRSGEPLPSEGFVVVAPGEDWLSSAEFGRAAADVIEATTAPVLVVYSRDGAGTGGAAATPGDGWPFVVPARPRAETQPIAPVTGAQLRLLDEYGVALDARAVDARLSIGRAEGNDWTLATDPLVSRRHAEIVREGSDYLLVDAGSTNGTLVWRDGDWLPVESTTLQDRDLLIIGANVFRYLADGSKEDPDGQPAVA